MKNRPSISRFDRRALLKGTGAGVAAMTLAGGPSRLQSTFAQSTFPAEGTPFAGTKLRVAMVAEPKPVMLKGLLGEFTDLTGIEVEFDDLAYPTLQEKQLTALTQGGDTYDIVHVDGVWMGQYAGNGWIGSVQDLVDATDPEVLNLPDFLPALMSELSEWDGELYGLPFDTSVMMFYYRPSLLEKYGLEVPQTWDDTLAAATAITAGEQGNDIYGITLMAKRGVQLGCTYTNLLGSYGGRFYDENYKATLTEPAAVSALETLVALVGQANPGSLAQDYDEGDAFFSGGQAAMFIQWNDSIPAYGDPDRSKIVDDWDVAVIPGNTQADGTLLQTPVIGGWNVGILADTPNRDAAWEFMLWATSPDMEKRLAEAQPPARASVLSDPDMVAQYPQYPAMLESFSIGWGRPRIPEWPQMADAIEASLSAAVSGDSSPEDALSEANDLVDQVLMAAGLQK